MAQIIVRNVEDEVKAKLRKRARQHGRSMEEEVRVILRDALKNEDPLRRKLGDASTLRQSWIEARRNKRTARYSIASPRFFGMTIHISGHYQLASNK